MHPVSGSGLTSAGLLRRLGDLPGVLLDVLDDLLDGEPLLVVLLARRQDAIDEAVDPLGRHPAPEQHIDAVTDERSGNLSTVDTRGDEIDGELLDLLGG